MTYAAIRARSAQVLGDERTTRCICKDCPNRWTVDAGRGRLCWAHAWADPTTWPEITQAELWRQREADPQPLDAPTPEPQVALLNAPDSPEAAEVAETLDQLAAVLASPERRASKAWAHTLRGRELAGAALTIAQRRMWRAALARAALGEG